MQAQHFDLFIDGQWVKNGKTELVTEPYSAAPLGSVAVGGEKELEQAITAAQKAFQTFSRTPRHYRHDLLRKIQDRLRQDRAFVGELIARDAGKPISQALGEVDRALMTFELAAQETYRMGGEVIPVDLQQRTEGYYCATTRFPIGPISAITPFNFPLNLLAHKIAPCIAIGSTMVLKVPPQAPLAAFYLAKILDEAGVPRGVFNVLHLPIPVAERLATDERFKALSFTGSAKVGWHLKSIAGKKKTLLELGGNAGVLVHEDADIDAAIQKIAVASFAYAGQVCIKSQRIYAHQPVYDRFLEQFVERARAIRAGDPMDPATVAGPVIDKQSYDRILAWVEEARAGGAKIACGGTGSFPIIQPTVITGAHEALKVNCLEIFGPVVTVAPYQDWNDGLALINTGPFGLQAGIFTNDLRRIRSAYATLEVGGLVVNDVPTVRVDNYPYGGVKDSGFGREGVRYAMEEMSELKVLLINGGQEL